jgi:hypothetical protein
MGIKGYYPHHPFIVRYADAATCNSDEKWYFAEPHYREMTMRSLLSKLESPSKRIKQTAKYRQMIRPQATAIIPGRMSIISNRKMAIYTTMAILPADRH